MIWNEHGIPQVHHCLVVAGLPLGRAVGSIPLMVSGRYVHGKWKEENEKQEEERGRSSQ